jgi:hypothetical protein
MATSQHLLLVVMLIIEPLQHMVGSQRYCILCETVEKLDEICMNGLRDPRTLLKRSESGFGGRP